MDTDNLLNMDKVLNSIKINESLDLFRTEMGSEPESKPQIEGIHLHHKGMSN